MNVSEPRKRKTDPLLAKVLGYIAAMNDGDILDDCINGLLAQTYPVSGILVVDNGSTDGTQSKTFPEEVVLICHGENRGTNGAVITGFEYALARDYDWIWVFDADTVPRGDALQQLIELYQSFPANIQNTIRLLGSLPVDASTQRPHHGIVFNPGKFLRGYAEVNPDSSTPYYECDSTIWSGSLFKLDAVRKVGLPPADYFLDWGDHEYGYVGRKAGYRAFMSCLSVVDHNLHPVPSSRSIRIGPIRTTVHSSPPARRYYFYRNFAYFWFHEYNEGYGDKLLAIGYLLKLIVRMLKIALFNHRPFPELSACAKGLWHGLKGDLRGRF